MNLATHISSDLWNAVRRSYDAQAWSNAILDAVHHFSDAVRLKSGLQSDGTALAGQAFGGKDPKIKLNRLATESEKNIQAGIEQLVRGLYQAIRNPRSHERFEDSQKDCDSIIIFIEYLMGVIGHAKAAFSIDNVLSRINDESFVPNKRYADLILAEVPKNKRMDTLIAAFEQRDSRNASRQKFFFQAGVDALEESEREELFEVISTHLRSSADEGELRTVFQLLEPKQWLLISEADRMRSENRVIRSISMGRYSEKTDKCSAGGLATWAVGFFSSFSMKNEILQAIYSSLTSEVRERQDYVFKYFFRFINDLVNLPPAYLIHHIRESLRKGDTRYKTALDHYEVFGPQSWATPFQEELDSFKANDDAIPPDDFIDDDIPF